MPDGHVPETPGQAAVVADRLGEHLHHGRLDEAQAAFARLAAYFEEGDS